MVGWRRGGGWDICTVLRPVQPKRTPGFTPTANLDPFFFFHFPNEVRTIDHIVTYVPWWVVWGCTTASVRHYTTLTSNAIQYTIKSNQTALHDEVLPHIKIMRQNVLQQGRAE